MHGVVVASSKMEIQKQSTKFIKPATQTPPTLHHYKIGFIDECVPPFNISAVFFYSADCNDNPNIVSQLEKSLEKTLPRFYPLAGRYVEQDRVIECLDQGVEFIHAKVVNNTIKYEDIIGSEVNLKFVDEFIPLAVGALDQVTDPLLSVQVTTFESGGGVALGVSISHRAADTATLFTFLTEWAAISRGENFLPGGSGFNAASLFPGRGWSSPPIHFPRTKSSDNLFRSKYVTKKVSFSESQISDLRNKMIVGSDEKQEYFSKVQLVSAVIWKALIEIDQRTNGGYPPRCSKLLWAINLRGKSTSIIPSDSCGNLSTSVAAICDTNDETVESLARLVRKAVKDFMDTYEKVRHDKEQVQTMIINARSDPTLKPSPNSNAIRLTSWCKFPYYQLDFGFGKPIWVNRGRTIGKNVVYLLDDAGGNGVEAYVGVEDKDVPYFEEALKIKA